MVEFFGGMFGSSPSFHYLEKVTCALHIMLNIKITWLKDKIILKFVNLTHLIFLLEK